MKGAICGGSQELKGLRPFVLFPSNLCALPQGIYPAQTHCDTLRIGPFTRVHGRLQVVSPPFRMRRPAKAARCTSKDIPIDQPHRLFACAILCHYAVMDTCLVIWFQQVLPPQMIIIAPPRAVARQCGPKRWVF